MSSKVKFLALLVALVDLCHGSIITHIISSKEVVRTHNKLRTRVGTPDLSGDFFLAIKAKDCAFKMLRDDDNILEHPCDPSKDKQGENIYSVKSDGRTSEQALTVYERAFRVWESEEKDINFADPDWAFKMDSTSTSKPVFHYTQLVWRSTTKVGCGLASNGGESIVVCRYSPKGNTATVSSLQYNVPVPPQTAPVTCEDNKDFAATLCKDLSVCASFGSMCKKSCGLC
ncbi:Golgi-associated plant pathogenesis-related protein 1-like [Clytia hemisphaerica]|uniref:SCP domain-containing protein n=1 Tax=Clytia hemisphaerica TaxID=252671 RepID=A0A7M6DRT4_9CNID